MANRPEKKKNSYKTNRFVEIGVMKKRIAVLLIFLLCFGTVRFQVETAAEQEQETASLVLSSFDGGGPEYQITIEDPQIVSYTYRRMYDDPDHEMMTGSGYDNIYTFTGLKPGTTTMTVSMTSPLMENEDAVYTIVVDDNLNVTLSQERAITSFHFYRYGEMAYDSYDIITLMGAYSVSVNGEEYQNIDDRYVDEIFHVIEEYDLYRWDGFDESREDVLDGEGFSLEAIFRDGTSILASGDNAFPTDYFPAIGEIQRILESIGVDEGTGIRTDTAGEVSDDNSEKKEWIIGTDVAFDHMTDFYYTYDASSYPPRYQRYRFFMENGETMFYHETREGGGWPQTEEDITVSGTMRLSEDEWEAFCSCIEGGSVREREESLDAGDAGPWMFLYWDGDQSIYQEFAFASWEKKADFEVLCETLRESMQKAHRL